MPDQQLVVTGDGPELERRDDPGPGERPLHWSRRQQELVHLPQRARAPIVAADEDLGLTGLEAQGLRHTGATAPAEKAAIWRPCPMPWMRSFNEAMP